MIEIVVADACIGCDKCVVACPTNVFDRGADGVPTIARQSDCQTCFMCEAYCPTDALYVSPLSTPLADSDDIPADLIGSYRERLGWGKGREPGSRTAVGPPIPHGDPPPRLVDVGRAVAH
ncbi:ferredoxin family protein [Gordonia sp. ABSL11-1]|jgi:NAD-dependent dihydropyrimidine dehydrogenase PreA subunit|uniref:4Fe-4S dicluster domain-containing protein n=1 Tax=Gordonia sp. ABSL11-1 TaxID=3053924 RepID=UPI00257454B9|nr:ferredoxin family protein [Gordonia sp. ABSL11-1]MDL9947950.1 ferredoxin family protein [Gordonia sp. ABSL11-1]